jgi:hypothetical protein
MKLSRRTLLFRASAGAAAAGALVTAPQLLQSAVAAERGQKAAPTGAQPPASSSAEPVVAYVRDQSRGEVALYIGTREIIRHDPELVRRLLQAGG